MFVYTLYRLPQILSIGFIDSQSIEEVISIENQDEGDDDCFHSYKIEDEIDISEFVKMVTDLILGLRQAQATVRCVFREK